MIQTILIFALIYMSPWVELANISNFQGAGGHPVSRSMLAFYQSIQTFLTIGYGSVCPGNFPSVLVSGVGLYRRIPDGVFHSVRCSEAAQVRVHFNTQKWHSNVNFCAPPGISVTMKTDMEAKL